MIGRKAFTLLLAVCLSSVNSLAQVEYVPAPVNISGETVKRGKSVFYAHVVRERQTLYSIARAYGVSVQDIIDANPKLHLDTRMLEADALLYIPVSKEADIEKPQLKDPVLPIQLPSPEPENPTPIAELSSPTPASPEEEADTADGTEPQTPSGPVKLALLLPMGSVHMERNYVEFYFGALMAVKELAAEGIDVNVSVLNVSDSLDRTKMVDTAREADVTIGPFSPEDVHLTASSVQEGKFIISPLDVRTLGYCDSLPVILANTPVQTQVADAAEWCRGFNQEDTIIVVSETGGYRTPTLVAMKEQFDTTAERNVIATDYVFVEGFDKAEWFAQHTHFADTLTKIYICSDRDIFVKDIIRNANVQIGFGKQVEVYGPAKARSGEISDLSEAHVHASTTFHIDYSDSLTQQFVKDYRATFKYDPGQFAFHGYDTAKYFIKACASHGPEWAQALPFLEGRGLQTDFKFDYVSGRKGFINEAIRRVVYTPDYKAVIVR